MGGSDYNYEHFDEYIKGGGEGEFVAFRNSLHVGDAGPDFTAVSLDDGATVALSQLWQSQPVVMEFGSFT